MKREELITKTKSVLRGICKELGIPCYVGKNIITKDQMIDRIMEHEEKVSIPVVEEKEVVEESAKEEKQEIKNVFSVDNSEEIERQRKERKKAYFIDNVTVGMIVAFREPETGKLNTAMIQKISYKKEKLKLETQYKAQFIISFDDVVWLKTNGRFPKDVYEELKGIGKYAKKNRYNNRQCSN